MESENEADEGCCAAVQRFRKSRKLYVLIVFLALLLDNLLLTVVVPIIPEYLNILELHRFSDLDLTSGNDRDLAVEEAGTLATLAWLNVSVAEGAAGQGHLYNHSLFYNLSTLLTEEDAAGVYSVDENSRIGWLFSSKAIVQLLANPVVGALVTRYGYSVPLFSGFLVLLSSAVLFAFGESYAVLFVARAVQGVGSSCTAIAGMTLLAEMYTEDRERSRAMGIALGGTALGVLIGYPMGGVMYQFVGKMAPFLLIAGLALLEGGLQLWVMQPTFKVKTSAVGTPLHELLKDPYILLASGAILLPEMAMAMLESTLPLWLLRTMNPPNWQLGTVFLPDSVGYWLGCNAFGVVSLKLGRWAVTGCALLFTGVCLFCIPIATQMSHLIAPHLFLGLAIGMVDAALMPLLALLVETRHVAVYGSVYAIAQVSVSLGFALGSSVGGQLVETIGFPWLMRTMAIANLLYLPLCYFLRRTPSGDENKSILMSENGRPSYTDNDSFSYRQFTDE